MPVTRHPQGSHRAEGKRFAVVASRFNEFVVDKLVAGAVDALTRSGARDEDVVVFRCPGAFEIPGLAKRVLDSHHYDGLVCLGAVIRGETPHFDLVVNHAAAGVARIAEQGQVAVGFGVLACNTIEQALERAGDNADNRGADAAMVAIEMANLYSTLAPR